MFYFPNSYILIKKKKEEKINFKYQCQIFLSMLSVSGPCSVCLCEHVRTS